MNRHDEYFKNEKEFTEKRLPQPKAQPLRFRDRLWRLFGESVYWERVSLPFLAGLVVLTLITVSLGWVTVIRFDYNLFSHDEVSPLLGVSFTLSLIGLGALLTYIIKSPSELSAVMYSLPAVQLAIGFVFTIFWLCWACCCLRRC